jgi:hypothetical protein
MTGAAVIVVIANAGHAVPMLYTLDALAEPGTNLAKGTALIVILTVATLTILTVTHFWMAEVWLTTAAVLRTKLAVLKSRLVT